jgi:nitric-oxide synthase
MRWFAQGQSANPGLFEADVADTDELLAAAERFITLFHHENLQAAEPADRMRQIRAEVKADGTYRHTPEELAFAARVAWRNSSRCIGRLYWRTLQLRDRRHISAPDQVAAECFTHLREATNVGRIRPLITVFAPDAPGRPGPRIRNAQLIGYAGHEAGSGVTGDPAHVETTRMARELGWRPTRTVRRAAADRRVPGITASLV